MTRLLLPAACLFLAVGHDLTTDYTRERSLRIESTTRIEAQTTASSMTVDGQEVEGRGFGGGNSTTSRRVVQVDHYSDHADGALTKMTREFRELEGQSEFEGRDGAQTLETESPLEGVTLELTLKDGDVAVEVSEGTAPSDPTLLEGHRPTLALDGLLPEGEVEVGAKWEAESGALGRALGIDLERVLFPPPPREERGEGGGRGGRGRGFGGGVGNPLVRILADAEWTTELELTADDEEVDGVLCAVIQISAEAEGDMPEQQGFGRGGRDRAFGIESGASSALEGSWEARLEGRLLVAVSGRHPVLLELEGDLETEEHVTMSRGEREIERETSREYRILHNVRIKETE